MAMVYVTLILKGRKKLADVPETIRQEVIDILIDMDIDISKL